MADDDKQFFDEPEKNESSTGGTDHQPTSGGDGGLPVVSRRQFMAGAGGAAAAGAAIGVLGTFGVTQLLGDDDTPSSTGPGTAAPAPGTTPGSDGTVSHLGGVPAGMVLDEAVIAIRVNGQTRRFAVTPNQTLAEALRETLGLTGTKVACDASECSACTVLVNGVTQNSCSLLAIREEGKEIWTIEGMARNGELSPVQAGFVAEQGLQCGYCTPGQIMQATGLLLNNSNPTEEEIRHEMSGNLCKCAAYPNIIRSVQAASRNWNGWQL